MWPFSRSKQRVSDSPLFLTNTLSGEKERFVPRKPGQASLYTCGPTVYSEAHIGNLRAYIFSDTLARTLTNAGFRVRRVINITDVGHLTDDADTGEDKMELGAQREGVSAQEIAERYTALYIQDLADLSIDVKDITFPRATQYIKEQIALIQTLEEKGHTYITKDGVYFDISTFPAYGKLGNVAATLQKEETLSGAGQRITHTTEKRHPADFALWKFSHDSKRQQEWESPWGTGFPGWHIECSAMSKALLGVEIDIHTGGMDHIPVHHNDEIAQSEGASGKPLATYWLHNAFVTLQDEKLSKSENRVVYLHTLKERGIHPLALRYFYLQAHYRSPVSFTWEALEASSEALKRLWKHAGDIQTEKTEDSAALEEFMLAMRNDLNTSQALAILWDALRSAELRDTQKRKMLVVADAHLGLSLLTPPLPKTYTLAELPLEVQELAHKRQMARDQRDFATSDELRIHIADRGYLVEDTPSGPLFTEKTK